MTAELLSPQTAGGENGLSSLAPALMALISWLFPFHRPVFPGETITLMGSILPCSRFGRLHFPEQLCHGSHNN
eukprot:6456871-Amphidinium_carterae.1